MTSDIEISCDCGAVKARLSEPTPKSGNRLVCYCRDCQAFAGFLGRADAMLDDHGGTDIFQTRPSRLSITHGRDQLACARVTPKGIYRWYAKCCHSPIANTAPTAVLPFAGLFVASMKGDDVDARLGPVRGAAFTKSAHGDEADLPPKISSLTMIRVMLGIFAARIKGDVATPFFGDDKQAIAEPHVLSAEARAAIDAAIASADAARARPGL